MTSGGPHCRSCLSVNIINDTSSGDTICSECGVVFLARLIDVDREEIITFTSSSSSAGGKDDKSRSSKIVGISGSLTSAKGSRNPNSKITDFANTLNSANNSVISYKEQKISDGLRGITRLCVALEIQENVKVYAESIWDRFEAGRKKHTRSGNPSMYLAIIFKACKDKSCSRSLKDLSKRTGVDQILIRRAIKRLEKTLENLEEQPEKVPLKQIKVRSIGSRAADAIERMVTKLSRTLQLEKNVENKMYKEAKIISKIAATFLEGKKPVTVAAAALLFQIRLSQEPPSFGVICDRDVYGAANIAASTLRNAYRTLEENKFVITAALGTKLEATPQTPAFTVG